VAVLTAAATVASADTLITTDGRVAEGLARFEPKGTLVVTPASGAPVRVTVSEILRLSIDNPKASPRLRKGVLLTDGTALPGDVRDIGRVVKFRLGFDGREVELPLDRVATYVFGDKLDWAAVAGDRAGAVLANGDFFEGDVTAVDENRATVSSLIFGPRTFERQALVAVVARPATSDANAGAPPFLVRVEDGALLRATSLETDKNRLIVIDGAAGRMSIDGRNVTEIRAAGDAVRSLADLRPARVDGGSGGLSAYAVDAPDSLPRGARGERWVTLRVGGSVGFDLPAGSKTLVGRVGVPDGVLPTVAVKLVALADGKPAYTSPPLTSLSPTAGVSIPLTGVKRLTLRAEVEGDVVLPVPLVLVEPLLVKE
jgi:hypothetical protein